VLETPIATATNEYLHAPIGWSRAGWLIISLAAAKRPSKLYHICDSRSTKNEHCYFFNHERCERIVANQQKRRYFWIDVETVQVLFWHNHWRSQDFWLAGGGILWTFSIDNCLPGHQSPWLSVLLAYKLHHSSSGWLWSEDTSKLKQWC
jgi:hypothetical protein